MDLPNHKEISPRWMKHPPLFILNPTAGKTSKNSNSHLVTEIPPVEVISRDVWIFIDDDLWLFMVALFLFPPDAWWRGQDSEGLTNLHDLLLHRTTCTLPLLSVERCKNWFFFEDSSRDFPTGKVLYIPSLLPGRLVLGTFPFWFLQFLLGSSMILLFQ